MDTKSFSIQNKSIFGNQTDQPCNPIRFSKTDLKFSWSFFNDDFLYISNSNFETLNVLILNIQQFQMFKICETELKNQIKKIIFK